MTTDVEVGDKTDNMCLGTHCPNLHWRQKSNAKVVIASAAVMH